MTRDEAEQRLQDMFVLNANTLWDLDAQGILDVGIFGDNPESYITARQMKVYITAMKFSVLDILEDLNLFSSSENPAK